MHESGDPATGGPVLPGVYSHERRGDHAHQRTGTHHHERATHPGSDTDTRNRHQLAHRTTGALFRGHERSYLAGRAWRILPGCWLAAGG